MKFSRRGCIKLLGAAAGTTLLPGFQARAVEAMLRPELYSGSEIWNHNWNFQLEGPATNVTTGSALPALPNELWQTVNLPHCGVVQAYDVSNSYQGLCWYRKLFVPEKTMHNQRVVLEFEGAMQVADLWVDGKYAVHHEGGYLPFFVDLTSTVEAGRPVTITLRLDNRDNPQVPPGKPQSKLDFCYFPGLYRNVHLHVTNRLCITDAVQANRQASGGIFVRFQDVTAASATVLVQALVTNSHVKDKTCTLTATLFDAENHEVGSFHTSTVPVTAGGDHTFSGKIRVNRPRLWSTRDPYLHTLTVQLMEDGRIIDERRLRIGIRTLRANPKLGFFLNGEHIVPSGANRHQAYPYVGNALSDQAQYRDARLLKEAGFDLIRLSHYPQATAFLDACDELGLMTIQCIPGWQFFNDSDKFRNNVRQSLRDLIRRDRNHPCAVLWECSLNETSGHDSFIRELVELAHSEYPDGQMLTCGDTEGHDYNKIRYEVPYSGWDDATETRPNLAHGMMSLHREYGDNQFGGYSRYSRGDGERMMLVQAWNYQTAMNEQLELPYTWGQCIWEAIDNCRGMSPEIATCGALDQFRLPKFMYEFYRSQRNPEWFNAGFDSGPMVFIANYWMVHSTRDVVVFSNCDEVGLNVNGREVARRWPDNGSDVSFGDHNGFDLNYWMRNANSAPPRDVRMKEIHSPVYNGGNCRYLPHPPFTFSGLHFEPGELKATGYRNGRPVAEHVRRTPGPATGLRLRAATRGRAFVGNGSDLIILHADICDSQGTVVPDATHNVRFELDGPGRWVGDNPRRAEAGIASVLLRSTGGLGRIHMRASTLGLHEATLTITPDA